MKKDTTVESIDTTESVLKDVDFRRDKTNPKIYYASYTIGKSTLKFSPITSRDFSSYLRITAHKLGLTKFSAESVIQHVQDFYTVYNDEIEDVEPCIRTSGSIKSGHIEYALNDKKQNIVHVDSNGWSVKPATNDNCFLSFDHMQAQVIPKHTTESIFDLLAPYINLTGDNFKLFVIWLISALTCGEHSALLLCAEKGSGKSHASRLIRSTIDPSELDVTRFPSKTDDLINGLINSRLMLYDNISTISRDQSDTLCTAITGATTTKRALYTDSGICIRRLSNIIVLNGIGIIPGESDLAERLIYLKLPTIEPKKRKESDKLWDSFEAAKPEILGAMFNALSEAIRIIDTISIEELPRMASSFVTMAAIAIALGIELDEYIRIYKDNITAMNKARLDCPLAVAIREYMNSPLVPGRKAEALASKILANIRSIYTGDKSTLPKSASAFTQRLRAERVTFEAIGYSINIDDTHAEGTYVSIIKNKK